MNQEAPPPVPYKDTKTRLGCFGVLTLLAGVICGLFVLAILAARSLPANPEIRQDPHALILGAVYYGILAVVLIWLGIGSIMARRWARALILIFSWNVLIVGVMGLAVMVFMAPQIMEAMQQGSQQAMQQAAQQNPGAVTPELGATASKVVFGFIMLMMGVIFVILPIIWILAYGSKNAKATCETRDPVVRWTDRCPLPVLGASIWMAISALMMLLMPLVYYTAVLPFFGQFITGPAAMAGFIVLAVAWGYCACAIYKLSPGGWWVAFILMCVFPISGCLTYLHHNISELYQLMGMPEKQIAQIGKFGFLEGHTMAWIMLGCGVPWLAYLLYIRRYFHRTA